MNTTLKNKKIALLGLGIENYFLLKFLLKKKIKSQITICDAKTQKQIKNKLKEFAGNSQICWQLGANYNKNLTNFDIIFRSPGYPLFASEIKKAKKRGVIITSAMRLFFELCPTKNIIGVTGTKGKGTTSSLIYKIIKTSGRRVFLGGNIGVAPFSFINKIKKNNWVVLELSSFQLEDFKQSPRIAVITNFSPEHLSPADPNNPNYHPSLEKYWQAKSNIFKHQNKKGKLIINRHLLKRFKNTFNYNIFSFATNCPADSCFRDNDNLNLINKIIKIKNPLPGKHNQENIAAAALTAKLIGVSVKHIKKAIKNFRSLPHRLELVGKIKKIEYYNDSFATTPEAAITALEAFDKPIIWIGGGADKGSSFAKLASKLKKKTKAAILFKGKGTQRIIAELKKVKYPQNKIKIVNNMPAAIKQAQKFAQAGDIILLSPACASFGIFKNYKERGELFKKITRNKIKMQKSKIKMTSQNSKRILHF